MGASVVASCDTPPVLEFSEQIFDFVPSFVCSFAVLYCFFAVFLRRDARFDLLLGKYVSDLVAVIPAIPDQGFGFWRVFQQHIRTLEVTALPFGQVEPNWSSAVVT